MATRRRSLQTPQAIHGGHLVAAGDRAKPGARDLSLARMRNALAAGARQDGHGPVTVTISGRVKYRGSRARWYSSSVTLSAARLAAYAQAPATSGVDLAHVLVDPGRQYGWTRTTRVSVWRAR